jgi:predicted dehydrogenase
VQVVSVCTPDRLHAEQARFALAAGKHVLCEKPMAATLEDAAMLVRAVHESGLLFMVGHNYRFAPQFAKLKDLAEGGAVGPLLFAESSYVQDLYFMEALGPAYWRLKDPQDFVLGGAVHNVDLLRWVVGEVEEVQAYSNHGMPFYSLDDNYVINLRFAGGRIGRLLLLLGSRLKDKFFVNLDAYGPEGSLRAVMQRDEVILNSDRADGAQPQVIATPPANAHALEIAYWVDCVRSGRQPSPGVRDGAQAVAICIAAIRSAREGRPVGVSSQ